jgi:hypothetical protein
MTTRSDDAVTVFRERMRAKVAQIKADLEPWIARHGGPAPDEPNDKFPDNYVEISSALLETAIDRYIWLHGTIDAFEFIESVFRRQANEFKRSLQ